MEGPNPNQTLLQIQSGILLSNNSGVLVEGLFGSLNQFAYHVAQSDTYIGDEESLAPVREQVKASLDSLASAGFEIDMVDIDLQTRYTKAMMDVTSVLASIVTSTTINQYKNLPQNQSLLARV